MALFVAVACRAMAQTPDSGATGGAGTTGTTWLAGPAAKSPSRAWELGIGGSVFQFSRVSLSNFSPTASGGYMFDLKLHHAVFGGNLYAAMELNDHFYLDLQGTIGATGKNQSGTNKAEWLFMVGPGLQWRLGAYFGSKYIDPYLRAGINYMYKGFEIMYVGTEGMDDQQMQWALSNIRNKEGADRKNLMPIALGAGLNMWLNDRWGIGMQGDYLLMPYGHVANSLQGTVRAMYRIGGGSKKPQPAVQYVDRYVDRVVEVVKPVEAPAQPQPPAPVAVVVKTDTVTIVKEVDKVLTLDNINFDFGKANLKPESKKALDHLAEILKHDTAKRYLVTGYTDAQGNDAQNLQLSRKRAEAVVDALIARGVPSVMLKARGVGSKIAYAKPSQPDEVRHGDRKITIEPISNKAYWDYLPASGF